MADDGGMFAPLGPGAAGAPNRTAAKDQWLPIIPVPDNTPPAPARHPYRGEPSGRWTYRNADGRPLGQVWRFDRGGDDKEFYPLTFCERGGGRREWRWKGWPVPRPLYGLDRLAQRPAAPVVVAEGEKSADASAVLLPEHVAVTSPNGAESAHKADWSPLTGRDVTLWPDNDDQGRAYAAAVARALRGIAASVKIAASTPGAPEKWDAANALAEGWDQAKAAALITAAVSAPGEDAPVPDPVNDDAEIARLAAALHRQPNGRADLSPEFSDDALALEFTERHKREFRYVAKWGTWLNWDGTRWKFEDTLKAIDLARAVARYFANHCSRSIDAPKIASAKTVAAIEKLARADRRHAATVDQWDGDPWVLNTPGGIVDLHTGNLLLHDPERFMTKITAVAPGGECPLWRKFLAEITGGNAELQAFLQRIAGYALSGSVREHALFFFYGTGGNGKGVFLNTLTAILGDYAAVAPMETFIVTQVERHPTDLAGLRGARLVTAQETERGRRWAESKIKALTGGDPITARFMRQDFFTYAPAFKLVIAGNHKPALSGVDEAMRRRFHLTPFTVTITEPDKELPNKLRDEWPGILAWMIEGCLRWLEKGLNPPATVQAATATYLSEEDSLAQWVEECCITGKGQWGIGARLWASWKTWAETNNDRPGSRKAFAEAMANHGYTPAKSQQIRGYAGIILKPDERARGDFD